MAALLAVAALLALAPPPARACSAFATHAGGALLVAKNFDWPSGDGWLVLNERGRRRSKLVPGGPPDIASWSARFASVSFSTVGPGFPISGMNEAGLTIEALVDASAERSLTPDPGRLTGLELVQYGLDHFDTAEALAAFAEASGVSQLAIALHFFACDRGGACVVIESRGDGARVVRGRDLASRVLANRAFRIDAQAAAAQGGAPGAPRAGRSSGERFAAMAEAVEAAPPRDVDEAFRLLDRVRIPGLTKWQLVWDVRDASVHYRDEPGAEVASLRVGAASVPCAGPPRARAIGLSAPPAPFVPWSATDAAHAGRAVRAALASTGASPASGSRLAAAVAAATQATACAPAL